MKIALPHELGRDEVRRRLQSGDNSIADAIPGGLADIATSWPHEDRMDLAITAMGQAISGQVDITDSEVVFTVELPAMLGFIEPMVESAIRSQGHKLLAPPADG